MTALPEWMTSPAGLSIADYEALPEEICRQIEVVDGAVFVSPSPRRTHQLVVDALTTTLRSASRPQHRAVSDVDLRLRDVPLLIRRPDIVVYDASLPNDEVLRPEHCLLVVEVMSTGSVTMDQVDKPGEYAVAGIKHFWRVEDHNDPAKLTVYRYGLDSVTRTYGLIGTDNGTLDVANPVQLSIKLAELLD